ncbi:DUF4097 family beta strand repeat-containing protein [Actinoalloteichus hymeniacidonis]|uniref:DUF4098 family protein n=1 Tax=Actinoalloteichus hymeniacidonis TaxID=340345 RepID=A0AAC9HNQ6_9PSEU|nr:DUF4097 family beta strand repeat-containing protein [Actinoalloteichus hymeniacidonis]AOS62680.1 putative DUF4098 family protein [Actinoalloteichus hymeniacidonis]MBB5909289.1 hypothetical protein [Actinoalloteichus hymeniacidonis]
MSESEKNDNTDSTSEITDSTEQPDTEGSGEQASSTPIRTQYFATDGPAEIDAFIAAGHIEVTLSDEPGVAVEVRHDPSEQSPLISGLHDFLGWVSEQINEERIRDLPGTAIRATRLEAIGRRVLVRTPKDMALRQVAFLARIRAPHGSTVVARTESGDITVTGTADRVEVHTGAGRVRVERADGHASVHGGTGDVKLGELHDGLTVRVGTGDLEIASVTGPATVNTGTGDVWLGVAQNNLSVRTGSGAVSIAEAVEGRLEVISGSGDIRVGIRAGVDAELDVATPGGTARSELAVSNTPPAEKPAVALRARTGAGNALITRAAAR